MASLNDAQPDIASERATARHATMRELARAVQARLRVRVEDPGA